MQPSNKNALAGVVMLKETYWHSFQVSGRVFCIFRALLRTSASSNFL